MHAESKQLEDTVNLILNETTTKHHISNDILQVRWPIGVPMQSKPETRHDLLLWSLMNETHQITPDSENNVKLLSRIDQEDIKVRI